MRRGAVWLLAGSLAWLVTGCSSGEKREELARQGLIDQGAAVKAVLEITIKAPPEEVWKVLTNLRRWPRWQPAISDVVVAGPIAVGTAFDWKMVGTAIHSRIEKVEPGSEIAWSGKTFGAAAIHTWKLTRLSNGGTLVHMEESMDGMLLRAFYSSNKLRESDQAWLDALKIGVETR